MLHLLLILSSAQAYIKVPLKASYGSKTMSFPKSNFQLHGIISLAAVENIINLQYNAIFQIGTPPQSLSLLLDTGSSWTWIPSLTCKCHESDRFNHSSSSTYNDLSNKKTIQYGKGKVIGTESLETFRIDNLTSTNQRFILISKDYDLDGLESDGLLGLGFKELSNDIPTLVDNLKAQNQITNSIFSIYLNNINNSNSLESVFTIGGYDIETYGTGNNLTINIDTSYGFWLTSVDKIITGGKGKKSNYNAIWDTGTSLMTGPNDDVEAIFKQIMEKAEGCAIEEGYLICNCTQGNYKEFPDIKFIIENKPFTLTPDNYLFYENGYCFVLVSGRNDLFWILGQPLLREYYTVHDMDNKKMYFWKAKQNIADPLELNDVESRYFIYSNFIIPVSVVISGAYYIYHRRRQIHEYNYQVF